MFNKWHSRRWLITVWAITITTFIVLFSILTKYDGSWIGISLPLLIAIPSVYIVGDSITKKKE